MIRKRLDDILRGIAGVKIAVLGDFCLDAYWMIDRELSERSVETGKSTVPVRSQRYSLGGAANIIANLADLGVKKIFAVGVVGDDLFGTEMARKLKALKVDTSGLIVQQKEWTTPVYGKLYAGDEEEPRVDFGVYNVLAPDTEDQIIRTLKAVLPKVQVVILNQQLPRGVGKDSLIKKLNRVIEKNPKHIFIVDSRNKSEKYRNVIYRFNAHEAARLCGHDQHPDQSVLLEDVRKFAGSICRRTKKPVFISRGDRGSLVCWKGGMEIVQGIQIRKKIDTVGAGDTSVSAIAGALGAGACPLEAAILANYASAVTVQKLYMTGTASPDEIRGVGRDTAGQARS